MTGIIIIVAIVLLYVFFILYYIKKQRSAVQDLNIDLEKGKYAWHKDDLLEGDFAKIKTWMKDLPVDGFTSGNISQSTSEKVKDFATGALKGIALRSAGFKATSVEADYFWVLSKNELHFLSTDKDGDLQEHLVFDENKTREATLRYIGPLQKQVKAFATFAPPYTVKKYIISFIIEGKVLELEIHDSLKPAPNISDLINVGKATTKRAIYYIVGEKFVELISAKFPNLKTVAS